MKKYNALLLLIVLAITKLSAQDTSKLYFITSVGIVTPVSSFAKAYKMSLSLNSGAEYRVSKHYYAQLVLNFNAVKYNQQIKDSNSVFLFQNTNSSVLLANVNFGRNIYFKPNSKLFFSPYVGVGYANIGEPRLMVNTTTGIINQQVTRMNGILGKVGTRLAYKTNSKVLQTLYIDACYWTVNVNVQQSVPKAVTVVVGTRVGF